MVWAIAHGLKARARGWRTVGAYPGLYGRWLVCVACLIRGSVSDPRALQQAKKEPTSPTEAPGYTAQGFVPLPRVMVRFQVPMEPRPSHRILWRRQHRPRRLGADIRDPVVPREGELLAHGRT